MQSTCPFTSYKKSACSLLGQTIHRMKTFVSRPVSLTYRSKNPNNYDSKAPDGTDPYCHYSAESLTVDYDAQLARLAVFYPDMPIPMKQRYFNNPCPENLDQKAWYYTGDRCQGLHYTVHNHHHGSSDSTAVSQVPVPTGKSATWSGFTQSDLDYMAQPVTQHAIKVLAVMRPGLMISGHTAHEVITLWQVSEELVEAVALHRGRIW